MNYSKIYNNLISNARQRINEHNTYLEVHHIIPKCEGGTDAIENLVSLTPEEHLIAHLLLVKIHPNSKKLIYAANMMKNRVKNNKEYGWLKRKFAEVEKKEKTGIPRTPESIEKQKKSIKEKYKKGCKGPRYGSTLTNEHRLAISNANLGKIVPIESRSNLEGFILRYGKEEGTKRYQELCQKKSVNTLEYFVKKYGNELGTQKYKERSERLSQNSKGHNNHFYGKTHSEETKEKIRQKKIGTKVFRSEEHNMKISAANKGKKQELVTCPHCKKEGGISKMKYWHFDNCKYKIQ